MWRAFKGATTHNANPNVAHSAFRTLTSAVFSWLINSSSSFLLSSDLNEGLSYNKTLVCEC